MQIQQSRIWKSVVFLQAVLSVGKARTVSTIFEPIPQFPI
jgi:hypothetical protein